MVVDYLNASTNFMDKTVAKKIVHLFEYCMKAHIKPAIYEGENIVCVGPELAGGVSLC